MTLLDARRLVSFGAAGGAGLVADTIVLVALVEAARVVPEVAKVVAWEVAVLVNFAINDRVTFPAGDADLPRRLGRSHAVRLTGLLTTLAVLSLLYRSAGIPYLAANFAGVGVGGVANYLGESLWTWGVDPW